MEHVLTVDTDCLSPYSSSSCSNQLNDDDSACMICYGKFTPRRPGVPIPCNFQCNGALVHEKCIFEWQETKLCQNSPQTTCPLCRGEMSPVNYQPPDPLNSESLIMFQCRRNFVTKPLPKAAGRVHMYIRRFKSRYELWLQCRKRGNSDVLPTENPAHGDILLLVGSRQSSIMELSSSVKITLDPKGKDINPSGVHLVGNVRSSALGLTHTVEMPCVDSTRGKRDCFFREVAAVRYIQNRFGSNVGPRKMDVCIPRVEQDQVYDDISCKYFDSNGPESFGDYSDDEDDEMMERENNTQWSTSMYCVSPYREPLAQRLRYRRLGDDVVFCRNKQPYWLENIQAYSLDFQNRVTLPSNKNFQLVSHTNPVLNEQTNRLEERMLVQFGKVIDDSSLEVYTVDVAWPMSPVQAFGIAISACERKLACA